MIILSHLGLGFIKCLEYLELVDSGLSYTSMIIFITATISLCNKDAALRVCQTLL